MTALQRLLLSAGLAPLLLMALVAGLNLRRSVSLRVLVWRSPSLPVGAWIAIATGGGCALSCLAGLALQPGTAPLQRQVHRRQEADRPEAGWADMPWPGPEPPANHRATAPSPTAAASPAESPTATAASAAPPDHDDWSAASREDW